MVVVALEVVALVVLQSSFQSCVLQCVNTGQEAQLCYAVASKEKQRTKTKEICVVAVGQWHSDKGNKGSKKTR